MRPPGHRVLDRAHRRDLRADVEVEQLQQSSICSSRSLVHELHDLAAVRPNFEPVAGRLHPLAAPRVVSLARTPMWGRTPRRRATWSTSSSSRYRSITTIG